MAIAAEPTIRYRDPAAGDWFWEGRIAAAGLTFFAGQPMEGRRCVAWDLIARITRGHPWPDETTGHYPGYTILAGRDRDDDFGEELRLLGADPIGVAIMRQDFIPDDLAAWDRRILRTGDISLVVIDSWYVHQSRPFWSTRGADLIHRRHAGMIDEWSRDRGIPIIVDVAFTGGDMKVDEIVEGVRDLFPDQRTAPINTFRNRNDRRRLRIMNSVTSRGEVRPPLHFFHKPRRGGISWWEVDEESGDCELLSDSPTPIPPGI